MTLDHPDPAPGRGLRGLIRRYPAWVVRRHRLVLALGILLAVAGGFLSAHLPVLTDFSWLLPDRQPSVVALRHLQARRRSSAVIEIGVASPSPEVTARFAKDLTAALRQKLPPDILSEVDDDDGDIRSFVWEHRHLYASRADLQAALDALRERVSKASGFDLGLDDDGPTDAEKKRLDDLRSRLRAVRDELERPPGYVGEEGRLRMLVLRCRFGDTEPDKGFRTLRLVEGIVAGLHPASYDPALQVGYAGDPVSGAWEHDLILRDVVTSSVLCLVLVAGVLLIYFRALRGVLALTASLVMSTAVTFGFTRLWIGHLNTTTAFLGSVVAGNGINFGIIFLARYFEERRRRGAGHEDAVATAMSRTVIPTLVASAAAGSAYLSLTITTFRGFSEFGVIAGSGMIFCWVGSYTLLPALLTAFDGWRPLVRPAALPPPSTPGHGWATRRPQLAGALSLAVLLLTSGLALLGARRLYADPFEDDIQALRSRSYATSPPGRWSKRLDAAFGRDQSGGFYVGVQRPEDVAVVVKAVRDVERDTPPDQRQFGKIDALSEVLPGDAAEQAEKIRILGELRGLVRRIQRRVDPASADGKLLAELRPPPATELHPIGFDDLPERVRRAFTENDGRHGLLLGIHPAKAFDGRRLRGLERAVTPLRSLTLPPGAEVSGGEVIFVEMMEAVVREGPRASMLSLGLVLVLLLLAFGPRKGFGITAGALFFGVFGMLGLMALFGVRLNFINYIAIPITIGIGVDYPFNVVARMRQEGFRFTPGVIRSAVAVAVCSSTTVIGYAVLFLADTGAIRSFGVAAVLGELTCISAALVVVPALVFVGDLLARRRAPEGAPNAAPAP